MPGRFDTNRVSRAIARARAAGTPLIDLTITNPTAVGIPYPPDLLAELSAPQAYSYEPHARGMREARDAVAADYARRGIAVATDRIVLTASTSEAYSLLFKLLCEPSGDFVMVPVPSYPLFEHLTQLDGVGTRPYPLEYHGRWMIDVHALDAAWTDRVRAVLAVSPNNPTGSVVTLEEEGELMRRCAARDAALIVDEVFADYLFDEGPRAASAAQAPCLRIRLGGLSKSAGLPQVKLGWMALDGPPDIVSAAMERLELIADTYLSVSTPVQVAAGKLIARGGAVRAAIGSRIRENYVTLRSMVAAHPSIEVLNADGGWSAVVRIPARGGEEQTVLDLLDHSRIVVHPGYFFDFPHEAFLVVSLLPEPAAFREGIARMLERLGD